MAPADYVQWVRVRVETRRAQSVPYCDLRGGHACDLPASLTREAGGGRDHARFAQAVLHVRVVPGFAADNGCATSVAAIEVQVVAAG
jgi:hypothetical protein